MSWIDSIFDWGYDKREKEESERRARESLACDLLSGHGGLSRGEAAKLSEINTEAIRRYEAELRKQNFEYRKIRKEKLKNPQSIYLRGRVSKN